VAAPRYDQQAGWILDLSARHEKRQTDADTTPRVIIHVCETCRSGTEAIDAPRDGAILSERAKALSAEGVEILSVACLANCKRALSASIQSADGWSYVFGDLTTDSAEDLLEGARLLGASTDGLMPWKGRPDTLKRGMIARMPPLHPILHSTNKT
jgi:predicted metal-binding protein